MPGRKPAQPTAQSSLPDSAAPWADLRDEDLLDWRLCDLNLRIEGTPLESRIHRLYQELRRRGLRLPTHCWLAEEWFSPDGVPGIAVPFYLAHPRLMRLEAAQMHHVEGGTRAECMRILRHEAGHVVDTAWRLRRRAQWRELFGRSSQPYPDTYVARPASREYVLHLDSWYAQSHPAEDFAETFAVWLTPGSRWRELYAQWPALAKLRYVDELMKELAGQRPKVRSRARVEPLSEVRKTLREHYAAKQAHYSADHFRAYDRDLRRMFPPPSNGDAGISAAAFLRRLRPRLGQRAESWSVERHYAFDQTLRELIARAQRLKLRGIRGSGQAERAVMELLTEKTRHYLQGGRHRLAL
jgi:hypothetical protein